MSVFIKVKEDDVYILPKLSKDMKKVFKFPLGKTLRVDLEEGKIEGLKPYKKTMINKIMTPKTDLEKIYINGQIVEDYPVIYITMHKSLDKLEKSIEKEIEEDIIEEYTEVRDKKNKKIQDGGAYKLNLVSKGGGYMYRKKGGLNYLLLSNIANKAKKLSNDNLNILKKVSNGKSQKGGADIESIKKMTLENTKKIYNISKDIANKGMKKINELSKNALVFIKGGKYDKAAKEMKKIERQCGGMKKQYKKGNYCGGGQCGGGQCGGGQCGGNHCGGECKYCKKGGSSIKNIQKLQKKISKLEIKLDSSKAHEKEDIRKKIKAAKNLLKQMRNN